MANEGNDEVEADEGVLMGTSRTGRRPAGELRAADVLPVRGGATLAPVGAAAPRQKTKFSANYQNLTLFAPLSPSFMHPQPNSSGCPLILKSS